MTRKELSPMTACIAIGGEVDKSGHARLALLEQPGHPDPAAFGLSALEGELLDGLARIIARDMLRRRQVA